MRRGIDLPWRAPYTPTFDPQKLLPGCYTSTLPGADPRSGEHRPAVGAPASSRLAAAAAIAISASGDHGGSASAPGS